MLKIKAVEHDDGDGRFPSVFTRKAPGFSTPLLLLAIDSAETFLGTVKGEKAKGDSRLPPEANPPTILDSQLCPYGEERETAIL